MSLLILASSVGAHAQPDAQVSPPPSPPPVVLELFSSQGCAFCPPADALMGQMIRQDGVIGLSCHVDYFNVRDGSLGKRFCTERQSEYNRLIGTGPRYTPQLIVNGHIDTIGYETGKISAAIIKARAEQIAPLVLTADADARYTLTLPAIDIGAGPVRLWAAVFDKPKTITIGQGGNAGKTVEYYNVITRLDDLGPWDGAASVKPVSATFDDNSAGLAVLAQNTASGLIIAAGSIKRESDRSGRP